MMPHDNATDKALSLDACLDGLRAFVREAVRQGLTFHDLEQNLWQLLLRAGHAATQEFLQGQGEGDLGEALTLGEQERRSTGETASSLSAAQAMIVPAPTEHCRSRAPVPGR